MKFPTTNGKQSKGLGLKMARKIGAKIVDMREIQVHPTGFVDLKDRYSKTKILAAELIRGMGAILINQKGKREWKINCLTNILVLSYIEIPIYL